jgi:hypothetical protein
MKTNKVEKWLLLEQSGELPPRKLCSLRRALAASEDARALRNELDWLKGSVLLPEAEPSPWAVKQISARLRDERRMVFRFSRVWKPALALAACLAVIAGLFHFHSEQGSSTSAAVVAVAGVDVWNDPFEEDLNKLETLIVAISDEPLDIMEM